MADENIIDPEELLANTLTDVVGLTVAQATFIRNQGIRNAMLLARLDDDLFKEMLERPALNNIIITTKMRLRALRNWIQTKRTAHDEIDLAEFTNETCDATQDQMARSSSMKGESKHASTKDIKAPEKFSGKVKAWKAWKADFEAHLAQITGSNPDETPLLYVIRNDEDMMEEVYDELEGQMKKVYDAPLHGEHFMRDNFQVFQKLRALLTGGLAETYLSDYEISGNGREAWQELLLAYEGEDAKNTAITSAPNDIRLSSWERNTKNWTFDMYCLKHVKAHNILKRYGVLMDEATKVREFIRGINNSSLQSVKTSILLNKDLKTNLSKAIIEFKDTVTSLDLVEFDKPNNDERKIAAAQIRGGSRRGHSYRGGYKGNNGNNNKNAPYQRPYDNNRHGGYQGRFNSSFRGRGIHSTNRNTSNKGKEDDGLLLDHTGNKTPSISFANDKLIFALS